LAWMIDIRLWTTEIRQDMEKARRTHCSIHYNGIVYVFGGWDGSALDSCEKHSLKNDNWT
jgi:hypothetical protein